MDGPLFCLFLKLTYRVYNEGSQEGGSHPGSARNRHSADPHHGRKYLVGHLDCPRQGDGGEASPDHGERHPCCSLLITVWESNKIITCD